MRQSLFRQEVIQNKSDRLQGNVLLMPHITHSVWVGITGIFVLAIVLWLFFCTYTKINSARGWVSSVSTSQEIKENDSEAMVNENNVTLTILMNVEDVGVVKNSQKIKIKFNDLPVHKFGEFTATIVNIDDKLSFPDEFSSAPFYPESPAYKVNARLDNKSMNFHGLKITLRENMSLSASWASKEQPLYLWLVESLLGNKTGKQQ